MHNLASNLQKFGLTSREPMGYEFIFIDWFYCARGDAIYSVVFAVAVPLAPF